MMQGLCLSVWMTLVVAGGLLCEDTAGMRFWTSLWVHRPWQVSSQFLALCLAMNVDGKYLWDDWEFIEKDFVGWDSSQPSTHYRSLDLNSVPITYHHPPIPVIRTIPLFNWWLYFGRSVILSVGLQAHRLGLNPSVWPGTHCLIFLYLSIRYGNNFTTSSCVGSGSYIPG